MTVAWLLLAAACTPAGPLGPPGTTTPTDTATVPKTPPAPPPNVLVILYDDVGVDKIAVYQAHPEPPPSPHFDALAAEGVRFRTAYANPTCSPTRATLLTGRQPTRHGLGRWIAPYSATETLPDDELTIPEMLALASDLSPDVPRWSTAVLGKWHLAGYLSPDPMHHPQASGFDHHMGTLANPSDATESGHLPRTYEDWEKVTDGVPAWTTTYMTTDTFDDAITHVATLPEPWFLLVTPNAAHTPLHAPPEDLVAPPLPTAPTNLDLHDAMLQVLDDGLGRLIDSFDPELRARTTVIATSDNGTAQDLGVIVSPLLDDRGKGTVFEGGVGVPLVVTGPQVRQPGTVCDALVSLADVFPTVAEIAGLDPTQLVVPSGPHAGEALALDGLSLLPFLDDPTHPSARSTLFSEAFFPNGPPSAWLDRSRTVRSATHKLIVVESRGEDGTITSTSQFFRFEDGAWDEGPNLLDAPLDAPDLAAYDGLVAELAAIDAGLVYDHEAP